MTNTLQWVLQEALEHVPSVSHVDQRATGLTKLDTIAQTWMLIGQIVCLAVSTHCTVARASRTLFAKAMRSFARIMRSLTQILRSFAPVERRMGKVKARLYGLPPDRESTLISRFPILHPRTPTYKRPCSLRYLHSLLFCCVPWTNVTLSSSRLQPAYWTSVITMNTLQR